VPPAEESTPSEPVPRYRDGNVPSWGDEAGSMQTLARGGGHSNPGYPTKPESTRPSRESELYSLTHDEFTAIFHETLGIAVSHG
jgi:hypothetical protein